MCLILFAWKVSAEFPLVLAANRDEFHSRPTAGAGFWEDQPAILAGRDLEGRGTWLGLSRSGRFAAVTNFRDPSPVVPSGAASRGLLASGFLESAEPPGAFAAHVASAGDAYRGFNFLAGDREELWWVSNRASGARPLAPGLYGLSNHLLDTPWPKVTQGKRRLQGALELAPALEPLLEILADTAAADADLPDTGVGSERERLLSAARIVSPEYGTRCSSALVVGADGRVRFAERAFAPDGAGLDTLRYEFDLN